MAKTKTQKECYRSMDNSRKPYCRKYSNIQCELCRQADIRYNIRKQDKLQIRKLKNRQSAKKSKDTQALKWNNLLNENAALEQENSKATNELAAITWEKQRLISAIYNKTMEKTWRSNQIIADVANMIIRNPEDTIAHLHSNFGTIMGDEQDGDITAMQSEDHDVLQ